MKDDRQNTAPPVGVRLYRSLSRAAGPAARFLLEKRIAAGKEDPDRIGERLGNPTIARPDGALIWIHGASVGESLSVLPLVERLSSLRPDATFLVTTGTVTSAGLMAERLPANALHQFIPLDHPDYVNQFIDHWRPDAAIFVESEFWPNLISAARAQVGMLALVNGRVSPKSYESWMRRRRTIRYLLSMFDLIIAQDRQNADRLATLSGRAVTSYGNLKNAAPALPANENEQARLTREIGARPVWLAASTHPGEEDIIYEAHKLLCAEFPNLLTILAPRHPERGPDVRHLATVAGLNSQLRTKGGAMTDDTSIYIADTLGELGLFYRLSNVAFVGGSMTEKGGHNPLEPARLGCAILHGPYTFNFVETYQEMRRAGGAALVRNDRELATAVRRLIGDAKTRLAMAETARIAAEVSAEKVLASVAGDLIARLGPADRAA